jgi:hypothetical protein
MTTVYQWLIKSGEIAEAIATAPVPMYVVWGIVIFVGLLYRI